MTNSSTSTELPGTRGDPEHEMRGRILSATEARFRHYGYNKTTVADIASDLGVSTAYIYKFFASKHAICEAMVGEMVTRIGSAMEDVVDGPGPASEKLRLLYRTTLERSLSLYFDDRKMHELVCVAQDTRYEAVDRYKDRIRDCVRGIVEQGRARGEFETRTPLSDVVDAIWISLVPFAHPTVLEHLNDNVDLQRHARHMADLALRGMAKT